MSPGTKRPTESLEDRQLLIDWMKSIKEDIDEKFKVNDNKNDKILAEVAVARADIGAIKTELAVGREKMESLKQKDGELDRHLENTDKTVEALKEEQGSKKGHYIASALALATTLVSALIAYLASLGVKIPPIPPTGHGP